ncbi:MAG: mechanosensitive ion channel [Actinomycetaceae bacterium]|nr:mechanosensitive ion channel [Actinomycetaceae bacterium]
MTSLVGRLGEEMLPIVDGPQSASPAQSGSLPQSGSDATTVAAQSADSAHSAAASQSADSAQSGPDFLAGILPQSGGMSQSGGEIVATAAEVAVDITYIIAAGFIGAILGLALAFILTRVAHRVAARNKIGEALIQRIRLPLIVTLIAAGTWVGVRISLLFPQVAQWAATSTGSALLHAGLVAIIISATWVVYAGLGVLDDAARLRQRADAGLSRRFQTQAQVARRVVQAFVVVIGTCAALATFSEVRAAMATVLASAGLVSVVAGLAAQQTLGNVFAGIQLAFTGAISVGDTVVIDVQGESGRIEEVTLTYVVVCLWDERRLICPSTHFTTTPFQNWSRRAADQLGTVEMPLDWAAPIPLVREKVMEIVQESPLWDQRTCKVQASASDATTVTIRILVSARDSGALWDLRCHIRESLIEWIHAEHPEARPIARIIPNEPLPQGQGSSM